MTAATTARKEPATLRPRRSRRPITLGHAAPWILAVLTFILVLAVLRGRGRTVEVAIAASTINAGQVVNTGNVRTVTMHASDADVRAGIITSGALGPSQTWVASVLIHAGDPITRSEIARSAGPTGLASMSLPVPIPHADGGSISAGDSVDVIGQANGQAQYVARGLQVLSVSAVSSGGGLGAGGTSNSYYIVVAVDADTALRLSQALASTISTGAVDVVRTTGVANDQLTTPPASTAGAGAPSGAPGRTAATQVGR